MGEDLQLTKNSYKFQQTHREHYTDMKHIKNIIIITTIYPVLLFANDTQQWLSGINATAISEFEAANPTTLPNYPTTSTGNEGYLGNEVAMANDAATQATTDEGAQLIHGIPARPNIADEQWYQGAQNITANPSDYVDTVDADYTDCEEVIQEGDTYTNTQACTVSRISTTATCSQGRLLEVMASHLYSCNKELSTSNGNCSVGREIDVTQSHSYSCETGETTRTKRCASTLHITVKKALESYEPEMMCHYQEPAATLLNSPLPYGELVHLEIAGADSSHLLKYDNSCDVWELRHDSSRYLAFPGEKKSSCREGDELGEDGMCYLKESLEFTDALPTCGDGQSQGDKCLTEPAWAKEYRKGAEARSVCFSVNRFQSYNYSWYINQNTAYFGNLDKPFDKEAYKDNVVELTKSRIVRGRPYPIEGEPIAYGKMGDYIETYQVPGSGAPHVLACFEMLLANTTDPILTDPTYECGPSHPYQSLNDSSQCYSIKPPSETEITEEWVSICN